MGRFCLWTARLSSTAEAPLATSQTSMIRVRTVALAERAVPTRDETIVTLHQFARDLVGASDRHEILEKTLLAAARLSASQHATVLLLDDAGDRICYRVALDSGNLAPLELVAGPMMSKGVAGWVVRERRAALVRDTEQDARWLPGPGLGDLRSALVAPLVYGDRVLGVITLGHEAPGHYDDEHQRLLEIVGAQAAVAIEHARLAAAPAGEQRPPADALASVQTTVGQPIVREVVALSAELSGLSSAGAQLAPTALCDDVLVPYVQSMGEIIRRHEGTLASIAGDALLAIFAHPEHAPAHATRSALAMQAEAQRLRAHWRGHMNLGVGSLEIGIARGRAVIGTIGAGDAASYAVGEAICQAVRLRELARNDEILVSAAVAQAIERSDAFAVEALPPLRLRGAAPEHIFRVGAWRRSQPSQPTL